MKKAILPIVLAIVALAGTAYLALAPTSAQASGCCVDPATGLATCSPTGLCTACRTCSSCKNCSSGGSCSVCR